MNWKLSVLVLSLLGCQVVGNPTPDLGASTRYEVCRGPRDAGLLMWWRGYGRAVPWEDALGTKYICKKHGDGSWWFEAEPEGREVP